MGLIKKDRIVERSMQAARAGAVAVEDNPYLIPTIVHQEPEIQEEHHEEPQEEIHETEESDRQTEEHSSGTDENPSVELPVIENNEEMLTYAKGEAEEIIKKAMDEADAIKEHAREAGLAEARNFAEENASDKVKEALATLNQAVEERKKIIKDAEQEILRLAVRVSEQVIRNEVSTNRNVAMNMVTDAVSRISDREMVIIRVNRDDLENIKKYKDRIGSIVDGIKSLSIVEDASVEPGGCVIETNLGYVDARISTKLAAIEEAFRKVK